MGSIKICWFDLSLILISCLIARCHGDRGSSPVQQYRLMYFNARGAADLARTLMKVGNIDFVDYRYPITPTDTGGFETAEYSTQKSLGAFVSNLDRVPVLEVCGVVNIGQSKAIERYIATKCHLLGQSDEEEALIDCISENIRDIKDKWGKIRMTGGFGNNVEKEKAISAWFSGEYADWLSKLERSLPKNFQADDLAVGQQISYADISIWHLLRDYFHDHLEYAKVSELKAACQRLSKIADRVGELPAIKAWILDRPKTSF